MNANERKSAVWQADWVSATGFLPRRRFLGLCAVLLGVSGLGVLAAGRPFGSARGNDGGVQVAGPRERALREADLYRSHDLAG